MRNRSVPDFRANVGARYIEGTVNQKGNGSVAREQQKPRQADLHRSKRRKRQWRTELSKHSSLADPDFPSGLLCSRIYPPLDLQHPATLDEDGRLTVTPHLSTLSVLVADVHGLPK